MSEQLMIPGTEPTIGDLRKRFDEVVGWAIDDLHAMQKRVHAAIELLDKGLEDSCRE